MELHSIESLSDQDATKEAQVIQSGKSSQLHKFFIEPPVSV